MLKKFLAFLDPLIYIYNYIEKFSDKMQIWTQHDQETNISKLVSNLNWLLSGSVLK